MIGLVLSYLSSSGINSNKAQAHAAIPGQHALKQHVLFVPLKETRHQIQTIWNPAIHIIHN